MDIDRNAVVKHLSQSLKFRTVLYDDNSEFCEKEFLALHSYLEESFPLMHKELKEVINEYNLFIAGKESWNCNPFYFQAI